MNRLVMWLAGVMAVPAIAVAQNDRVVKGIVSLPPDSGSVNNVVVYLDGPIGTPTPGKATIDQREMTFVPHVLPVTLGSTVEFLNNDDVLHNVFSNSTAKHFDVGMFGRGESRSVTFDKPGIVDVRCNVHPMMRAFVVVLENSYFAIPDERGNYEISGIPAGRYKLRAWHESLRPVETWANLDDAPIRTIDLKFKQ